MTRSALVTGGSGHLGSAVVRALCAAGVRTSFTWHESEETAIPLARETGAAPLQVDLRDAAAVREAAGSLGFAPTILVHAAAIAPGSRLDAIGPVEWDEVFAVGVRSAFLLAKELAPGMRDGGEIVFCAALGGILPVAVPAHVGAAQGALLGLTRALAKELGPKIRVNLVAMGALDGGISAGLDPKLAEDFRRFSALGRTGTASEAARAILWVALENRYMTGALLPVSGGL